MKKRNTKQKQVIEDTLEKITSFFSAEELHKRVTKKDPNIGLATIYRYLSEQENEGNVFAYLCDRKRVYSQGQQSHCHFICEKTGKIIHFDVKNLDFLKGKIPGDIHSFQIEVRGVCKKCEEKTNKFLTINEARKIINE